MRISSVNFRRARHFCPKNMYEKLTKARILHNNCQKNISSRFFFWGGARAPWPPVSYAYDRTAQNACRLASTSLRRWCESLDGPMHWFALTQRSDAVFRRVRDGLSYLGLFVPHTIRTMDHSYCSWTSYTIESRVRIVHVRIVREPFVAPVIFFGCPVQVCLYMPKSLRAT